MSEWLTIRDAARHAKCGQRSIYRAVRSGQLRAARLGGRRELRFVAEWVDAWLFETSTTALSSRPDSLGPATTRDSGRLP